ncbi:MAG: uroporphyrinogen-III synthase [Bdellovibrionota bacterium]
MNEQSIIWTRALIDWPKDRELFTNRLSQVIHLPCIKTKAITNPALPQIAFRKEIITIIGSPKTVAYLKKIPLLTQILASSRKIYCIGESTAKTIQSLHLAITPPVISSPYQNMRELADELLLNEHNKSIQIFAPGPKVRAFDAENLFKSSGYQYFPVDLYETSHGLRGADGSPLTEKEINELKKAYGVVCFASPSAVKGFCSYLTPNENGLSHQLIAVAIGSTTMEIAKDYFLECRQTYTPSVQSLAQTAFDILSQK